MPASFLPSVLSEFSAADHAALSTHPVARAGAGDALRCRAASGGAAAPASAPLPAPRRARPRLPRHARLHSAAPPRGRRPLLPAGAAALSGGGARPPPRIPHRRGLRPRRRCCRARCRRCGHGSGCSRTTCSCPPARSPSSRLSRAPGPGTRAGRSTPLSAGRGAVSTAEGRGGWVGGRGEG